MAGALRGVNAGGRLTNDWPEYLGSATWCIEMKSAIPPLETELHPQPSVWKEGAIIHLDIAAIIVQAETALLKAPPVEIWFNNRENLAESEVANSAIFDRFRDAGLNIYALWVRSNKNAPWILMYIGQSRASQSLERLKQHLFRVPEKTESKLAKVREEVAKGCHVGITAILVTPDSLRLCLEAELIFRNTTTATASPWNRKGRCVAAVGPALELVTTYSPQLPDTHNRI